MKADLSRTRLTDDEPHSCERRQGNGEIVTDWHRYMHSEPGDVGDEAVAECPDCGGDGLTEAGRTALRAKGGGDA